MAILREECTKEMQDLQQTKADQLQNAQTSAAHTLNVEIKAGMSSRTMHARACIYGGIMHALYSVQQENQPRSQRRPTCSSMNSLLLMHKL